MANACFKSKDEKSCPFDTEMGIAYARIHQLDEEISARVLEFDRNPIVDFENNENYQRLLELKYLRDQSLKTLTEFSQNNNCDFASPQYANEELNTELLEIKEYL
jgi:hypothetical protein